MDTEAFNAEVLTTFGKVSQEAMQRIDGRPERLVNELVIQYGWVVEVARTRVREMSESLKQAENLVSECSGR